MRVLISGGGTGGHIYPALAVATQLRKLYQADILYLGSDDGLETQLVPAAGFRMKTVKAGKLQRYISVNTLKGIARVPLGLAQAVGIVRDFQPDVVFTSGGYVSVPAGLGAKLNNVPLLLHQQDVPPNLSNKLIAPSATRISIAFAASMRYFPEHKTLWLGNPIREEILAVRQVEVGAAKQALGFSADLPLLLITGGSQGARHLNQIVAGSLPELLKSCQVLQISGQKLYNETRSLADRILTDASVGEDLRQRYRLEPYMSDEMPLALQGSDLVICRSGASTLSELAVLEKPSLLVPLPPAIGSSPQEINAETFVHEGAADVVRNDDLEPALLLTRVQQLIGAPERLQAMRTALKVFAKPDGTQEIAEAVVNMVPRWKVDRLEQEGINA